MRYPRAVAATTWRYRGRRYLLSAPAGMNEPIGAIITEAAAAAGSADRIQPSGAAVLSPRYHYAERR